MKMWLYVVTIASMYDKEWVMDLVVGRVVMVLVELTIFLFPLFTLCLSFHILFMVLYSLIGVHKVSPT